MAEPIHLADPTALVSIGYSRSACGVWMRPGLLTILHWEVTCKRCRDSKLFKG